MPDDASERLRQFDTIKVPAIMNPQDGDPTAAVRAGIWEPIRIPVRIVTKGRRRRPLRDENSAPGENSATGENLNE